MCQLQEVHYACGHSRKKLYKPCSSAQMFSPQRLTRVPDHCLRGFEVVPGIDAEKDCGRGIRGYNCRQSQALEPLWKRYKEMQDVFKSYQQRAAKVEQFIQPEYPIPELNWEQLRNEKLPAKDIQSLKEQQVLLRKEISPMCLEKFRCVLELIDGKMSQIFQISSQQMLGELGSFDPCLEHSVKELTAEFEQACSGKRPLIEDAFDNYNFQAREELVELEQLALTMCLDEVGWQLPDDAEHRQAYQTQITFRRQVQPVRLSGTEARPQWLWPEPAEEYYWERLAT